jgi:hypothetical protein
LKKQADKRQAQQQQSCSRYYLQAVLPSQALLQLFDLRCLQKMIFVQNLADFVVSVDLKPYFSPNVLNDDTLGIIHAADAR